LSRFLPFAGVAVSGARRRELDKREITGAIHVGGRDRRMGGEDQRLFMVNRRPMVEHIVEALPRNWLGVSPPPTIARRVIPGSAGYAPDNGGLSRDYPSVSMDWAVDGASAISAV
jgi:hypothetical protein